MDTCQLLFSVCKVKSDYPIYFLVLGQPATSAFSGHFLSLLSTDFGKDFQSDGDVNMLHLTAGSVILLYQFLLFSRSRESSVQSTQFACCLLLFIL